MFPKEFSNSVKLGRTKFYHRAMYFMTHDDTDTTVKRIREMGIREFAKTNGIGEYTDNRISGKINYIQHADCCAFTKTAGVFYLFPIHKEDLANVGLDEQDLICWIGKLNDENVGFQYLYFGEQQEPEIVAKGGYYDWHHGYDSDRLASGDFYWVGVPKLGTKSNQPYLHWVFLRYLISTETSSFNPDIVAKGFVRLPFFCIPRITMMFHEEYNLPFLKSILYAHLANAFYSGNGLAYTDYMGISFKSSTGEDDFKKQGYQAPCVNLTNEQFKVIWENAPTVLNSMLTQYQYDYTYAKAKWPMDIGLQHLEAPYNPNILWKLFREGNYTEFIEHIENSYVEYEQKAVTA